MQADGFLGLLQSTEGQVDDQYIRNAIHLRNMRYGFPQEALIRTVSIEKVLKVKNASLTNVQYQ